MTSKTVYFRTHKTSSNTSALAAGATLQERIVAALRGVYDPEIPVNLYDLGLIYDISVSEDNDVNVSMTLTAPACPVAASLVKQVECAIADIEQVASVKVELVWEPPWTQDKMSDVARLELGLF